jgi:hypothetical protein
MLDAATSFSSNLLPLQATRSLQTSPRLCVHKVFPDYAHLLTLVKWDSVEKSDIQEKKIRVVWQAASSEDQSGLAATPVRHSLANGVRNFEDEIWRS